MNSLLNWIAELGGPLLLLATFLLAFGESAALVDFFVPGEAGMVIAGAAAERSGLALPWVIIAAVLGAVAGDALGYFVGRRWGLRVVRRWSFLRRHLEPKVTDAQRVFERRGGLAVFVSRWVGALRAVVPLIAGMSRMPYAAFALWNVLGAATWCATVVTAGYYFGDAAARVIDRYALVLSLSVVALFVIWYVWHRQRSGSQSRAEESVR